MINFPAIYSISVKPLVIDRDHMMLPAEIAGRLPTQLSIDLDGRETLMVTRDEEILSGRRLAEKLLRLGSLLQLEICDGTLKVRTALVSEGEVRLPNEELSLVDPYPLFQRVSQGEIPSPQHFFLAGETTELSIKPGFDQLLSLRVVQDVVPYQHQLNTVATVLRQMRGRALLCDEVGLGKTVEAGLVLMEYVLRALVKRVLILTPPSLLYQWQEEMARKFNLNFVLSESPEFKDAGPGAWARFDRIIASIYVAKRPEHLERVRSTRFDMVIVDEAHYLRHRSSQAWKLVNELDKKYILLLTATPVQNELEELYNLITLLRPGQLKTVGEFKKQFVTRGDHLKAQNVEELKRLVSQVMIRNRRSSAGITFTQRHAYTVKVEPVPEEFQVRRLVTELVREMYPQPQAPFNRLTLKTLQMESASSIQALIPTVSQLLAGPIPTKERGRLELLLSVARGIHTTAKLSALFKTLARVGDREKVIIFTHYLSTLHWLQQKLKDFPVVTYHGGLSARQKDEVVERFRKEAWVLLSTDSGGEGRNLQFCNLMVNFDLPWNPMRIEQRIGRLSRIGQQRDVYIFNLSITGTIEEQLLEILDRKINLFELVVGELDLILGRVEEEKNLEDIIMELVGTSKTDEELRERMEALGEMLRDLKEKHERVKELDDALFQEVGSDQQS